MYWFVSLRINVVFMTSVKRCEPRQAPENIRRMNGGRKVGDVRTFICKNNYRLVGEDSVECELQGTEAKWAHDFPTCEGK